MSTNSTINIQHKDGTIDGVYCHWDGYPSWNGQLLYAFYNTPEKVNELISHGGISSLGMNIGEKLPEDGFESYEAKKKNFQCEFYARDRGEKIEISHDKDIEQQAYNYLFDEEKEKWYLVENNKKIPLSKVIKEEYDKEGTLFEPSDNLYPEDESSLTLGDITTPEQLERLEVLRKTVMGELVEEIEEEPYDTTYNTLEKTILLPEIEDFLENHGFNVEISDNDNSCVEIQQYTPTGGDWSEIITISENATVGDFLKEIEDLYEGYDVKEEVKMYLHADLDGTPDADDLVEDIKWRENVLKEMTEDTSLDEIYRMSAHTFSLADTLPSRSFTLDESSLETGTENGKPYAEYLVEVWSGDETGRDFYDDIYERGEMWRVMDERCETFEELKANEGYEDATMDVYVRVYEDHSAALSAILKDNDDVEYCRKPALSRDEGKAIYDIIENCISKDRLEELFAEEREYAVKEKDEYNNTLKQFAEDNFYDREDIIRTYMSFAPLQEIIDFTGKPNVTMSNYKDAVNEVIKNTGNTILDNYADKFLEIMYQNNIKGDKYLDNLDTLAMGDSRAETAKNKAAKEITDD